MNENGKYPEGSINYLVSQKLEKYALNSAKYNNQYATFKVTYMNKSEINFTLYQLTSLVGLFL